MLTFRTHYLQTPCPQLWHWNDDENVVVWFDSSTACFAPQLALLLEPFRKRSGAIPPLTAILMILAATRRNDTETQRVKRLQALIHVAGTSPRQDMTRWFHSLHNATKDYRDDVKTQISVLDYALGDTESLLWETNEQVCEEVLQWLLTSPTDRPECIADFDLPDVDDSLDDLRRRAANRALRVLDKAAQKAVDPSKLEALCRIGRETLPSKQLFDAPEPKSATDLLDRLTEDNELSGLAHAAMAIAATIHLPRRPTDHDVLPAGGVSDIANRGNPEQLLMSELAQDPMVLLARIATGQALYLRRERPLESRPQAQPVLLEASIRTWGERRFHIAAIGLGLVAALQRRTDLQVKVLTIAGEAEIEESFADREGLIRHLERLDPSPHPGVALTEWAKRRDMVSDESQADPILVVSGATADDPLFQSIVMRELGRCFLIRIDPDRFARLFRWTALGRERLQSIRLQTDSTKPPRKESASDLPDFLLQSSCPLRFTYEFGDDWCESDRQGRVWVATRDARLLRFTSAGKGGVEIARNVRASSIVAFSTDSQRQRWVTFSGGDQATCWTLENGQSQIVSRRLDLRPSDHRRARFAITEDGIWVHHGNRHGLFDPSTGKLVDHIQTAGTSVGDACLMMPHGGLHVLSRHAGRILRQDVANPLRRKIGMIVTVPQRGRLAIASDLSETAWLGSDAKPSISGLQLLSGQALRGSISADGRRILVELTPKAIIYATRPVEGRYVLFSTESRPAEVLSQVQAARAFFLLENVEASQTLRAIRRKLTGVSVGQDGLILHRSASKATRLVMDTDSQQLRLIHYPSKTDPPSIHFGIPMLLDPNGDRCGPRLRIAKLPGGSVWLDSRGLLHLRAVGEPQQLTLVLHDSHVAGCLGQDPANRFGPAFFTGDPTDRPVPTIVGDWLARFYGGCR